VVPPEDSLSGKLSVPEDSIYYLALGDSYTYGSSVMESERWPNILVDQLRETGFKIADPEIIAIAGWTTGQLLRAIERRDFDRTYNMVSLLIGVNNQYGGMSASFFIKEFEALLDSCEILAEERSDIFVLSIPDYGVTPFGASDSTNIREEIDAYNDYIETICQNRGIRYYYITDISRKAAEDPELIARDNLHPSGKMYALWVDKIIDGIIRQFTN
jgi:lysophospholipase L1-like esterase